MIGFLLFIFGYIVNMFYISVLYHRGLAHGSVGLSTRMKKFVGKTGIWVTGIDPLAWALMHRVHHLHSDQEGDPHSPLNGGIFSVWISQYRSYRYYLEKMSSRSEEKYNELMKDIPFEVNKIQSNLPYLLHILLACGLGFIFHNWIAGAGYFLGIMGHPLQGWMINALAHKYGKRDFETNDNSRNNLLLSYFVFGEGLQNNHHAHPERANFAMRFPEFDPGYVFCKIAAKINLVKL